MLIKHMIRKDRLALCVNARVVGQCIARDFAERRSETVVIVRLGSRDRLRTLPCASDNSITNFGNLNHVNVAHSYAKAMSSIDLHVIHRGVSYDLSLLLDDTLFVLHAHLESLTAVPPARQKLLYKGKKPTHTPATTIRDAGLTNGIKVTMLGSTDQELGSMVKVENEQRRREQIMQDRASKGTVKARPRPIVIS